ncbi:GTPase Era [Helicobacter valdiviensis]|uniref:GTPase Era n=1 Tax=Helicobacter valdiviensis TaxID=1458358 RepID=A0A2W6MWZ1_9HELI|nr:GTPase Era [Helicobacter valdiviensis]PZT48852.1 GTPase Era [Helicobacter valdiviensis]
METKSGFVAVLGRPNAGKSTFLNALMGEKLALVSHKANATRKRMNMIVMYKEVQVIFVDTPGIHKQEKLLNQYMLKEAMQAMQDCDLAIFLAPISDKVSFYEEFLELYGDRKHFLLLTKTDSVDKQKLFEKIKEYEKYQDKYLALLPVSCKDKGSLEHALKIIAQEMPNHPYYYDLELLTPNSTKEIAKEFIRESCFENLSDEIPYESDVVLNLYQEKPKLDYIKATIIVHKESQKSVVIGKGGATLKRIGKDAREKIEQLVGRKVFLELFVKVVAGWSKEKESLKKIGYNFED